MNYTKDGERGVTNVVETVDVVVNALCALNDAFDANVNPAFFFFLSCRSPDDIFINVMPRHGGGTGSEGGKKEGSKQRRPQIRKKRCQGSTMRQNKENN